MNLKSFIFYLRVLNGKILCKIVKKYFIFQKLRNFHLNALKLNNIGKRKVHEK